MPFVYNLGFQRESSARYLKDLFAASVLRDVMKPNNFRDVGLFERIIQLILANTGKVLSATSVSQRLRREGRAVSPETVAGYINACEDAFLISRVKRQNLAERKLISSKEKYYLYDHGLLGAVMGGLYEETEAALENMVYCELMRRGYRVTVGLAGKSEIDFVAVKEGKPTYIQVSDSMNTDAAARREFGALLRIGDNYPKLALSVDETDMGRDGVEHMHIADFLAGHPRPAAGAEDSEV
jgi:predicted AAA+ superfamily ATPase